GVGLVQRSGSVEAGERIYRAPASHVLLIFWKSSFPQIPKTLRHFALKNLPIVRSSKSFSHKHSHHKFFFTTFKAIMGRAGKSGGWSEFLHKLKGETGKAKEEVENNNNDVEDDDDESSSGSGSGSEEDEDEEEEEDDDDDDDDDN
ncbi:hypothetical protein KEM56_001032, partial [Ascosphaera pollenicola]